MAVEAVALAGASFGSGDLSDTCINFRRNQVVNSLEHTPPVFAWAGVPGMTLILGMTCYLSRDQQLADMVRIMQLVTVCGTCKFAAVGTA